MVEEGRGTPDCEGGRADGNWCREDSWRREGGRAKGKKGQDKREDPF